MITGWEAINQLLGGEWSCAYVVTVEISNHKDKGREIYPPHNTLKWGGSANGRKWL